MDGLWIGKFCFKREKFQDMSTASKANHTPNLVIAVGQGVVIKAAETEMGVLIIRWRSTLQFNQVLF